MKREQIIEILLGRYSFFSEYDDGEDYYITAHNTPRSIDSDNQLRYFLEENISRIGNKENNTNATAKDLSTFLSNSNLKKGFYIGRFEARTTVTRTSADNGEASTMVTEKAEDAVYNWVTQLQASERSRNMYTANDYFESDLMNSYAWDTVIVFLLEFDDRANKTTPYSVQTGYGTAGVDDKICNIYDMATNCLEWTTETSADLNNPCVKRGGLEGNGGDCTSGRYSSSTNGYIYGSDSFRPILYLK